MDTEAKEDKAEDTLKDTRDYYRLDCTHSAVYRYVLVHRGFTVHAQVPEGYVVRASLQMVLHAADDLPWIREWAIYFPPQGGR